MYFFCWLALYFNTVVIYCSGRVSFDIDMDKSLDELLAFSHVTACQHLWLCTRHACIHTKTFANIYFQYL